MKESVEKLEDFFSEDFQNLNFANRFEVTLKGVISLKDALKSA